MHIEVWRFLFNMYVAPLLPLPLNVIALRQCKYSMFLHVSSLISDKPSQTKLCIYSIKANNADVQDWYDLDLPSRS